MQESHLGGHYVARHRIGYATLIRPDGSEHEAKAFCLDDDGHVIVAVKVAPHTWVREAVDAGALIFARDHDAQTLREAVADHAAKAAQATIDADRAHAAVPAMETAEAAA